MHVEMSFRFIRLAKVCVYSNHFHLHKVKRIMHNSVQESLSFQE